MTYRQFIQALKETPRTWTDEEGEIRNDDGVCPVCAVANHILGFATPQYTLAHLVAAAEIGLPMELAQTIADVADEDVLYCDHTFYTSTEAYEKDQKYRKDLLKACQIPPDQ